MQSKLLDGVIGSIAGKPAVDIMDLLDGKRNVNEFIIAKKLNMTINQIRNILYKLSDANLVSFIRKKDKRKGWYTYYWTLNLVKVYELADKIIKKDLENLKAQLKSRREKRFYVCKACGIDVTEETALLHEFVCSECGEVYQLNESEKIIKDIDKQIQILEKELKIVEVELAKMGVQKAKKIEKEVKKDKVEKAQKRAAKKKLREKDKKKEEKMKNKMKAKKKKPKKKKFKKKKRKLRKQQTKAGKIKRQKKKKKVKKKKVKKKKVKKKIKKKKKRI